MKEYIEAKIKFLRKDFKMKLTAEELAYMRSLKTEIQVDQYARTLFQIKL